MHKRYTSLEKANSHYCLERRRHCQGFSLIEVTLAIAIIATAFIALLGLLPAGLRIFKTTVDATNTMRISMHTTSLLQAAEFSKLATSNFNYNIYYYDADGGFLDTDTDPIASYEKDRVYAVRIIIDKQNVTVAADVFYDQEKSAAKTLIVVGQNNPNSVNFLKGLKTSDDVAKMPANARYKVLPLLVAKTDGNPPK